MGKNHKHEHGRGAKSNRESLEALNGVWRDQCELEQRGDFMQVAVSQTALSGQRRPGDDQTAKSWLSIASRN